MQCKNPFDFTYETNCKGFTISGTQPDFTSRRIIFKIDDKLYRFINNVLDEYPYKGDIDDVLKFGNTVGELLALDDIPAFIGRKVFPIIALDAPADAKVFPTIKLAVKVSSYNDIYQKFHFSPVYNLKPNAKIISIREIKTETGNATSITECRINKLSGWSDWLPLLDAEYQTASQIQFRTNFALTTLDGTDSSQINITIRYTDDADKVATNFRIFTTSTQSLDADLKNCYVLVKHSPLLDSTLQAYVNLREGVKRRAKVFLGRTAGIEQTLYLPNKYFVQNSLRVEIDGKPFYDYEYDTENSALKFTAPADLPVTAAFDYHSAENWQPMTLDFSKLNQTRFTFHTDTENLRECAVMLVLRTSTGNAEFTATGTGRVQTFALNNFPTAVTCNAPFKIDNQLIKICAPIDATVICNYNYEGNIPNVNEFIAGFSI